LGGLIDAPGFKGAVQIAITTEILLYPLNFIVNRACGQLADFQGKLRHELSPHGDTKYCALAFLLDCRIRPNKACCLEL
jgi:hypothetical protein